MPLGRLARDLYLDSLDTRKYGRLWLVEMQFQCLLKIFEGRDVGFSLAGHIYFQALSYEPLIFLRNNGCKLLLHDCFRDRTDNSILSRAAP